ncbi:hypothetical protein ACN28I_24270 [Archangium gephyra]|uniref:hypothetical protein n=1 Tax=Archangium gephyra TaxID=48 RepID=UPI003B7A96CB
MEHISLSAELGEIRYAIEGAHWIADSVAMGAVPDPERVHSAPVIISAILLLVENRLHQLGRVLRGEENPAHLLTPHNATTQEDADRDDVVLRAWDWSGASRLSPSEKKETEQPRPVAETEPTRSLEESPPAEPSKQGQQPPTTEEQS